MSLTDRIKAYSRAMRETGEASPNLGCCPRCTSGDLDWCQISVRAYCRECDWWAPVNIGSVEEGIRQLRRAQVNADVPRVNL